MGLLVPALAGLAVAAVGAGPTFAVTTALTALAALVVLRLRVTPTEAPGQHEPGHAVGALAQLWSEAREGWTVLRRNSTLWLLTVASMLVNLGLAVIVSVAAVRALAGSLAAVPLAQRCRTVTVPRASMLLLAPIAGLTLVALLDPAEPSGG